MLKKVTFTVLFIILGTYVYFVFIFDINNYKSELEDIISEKSNTELRISGDLELAIGTNTIIKAELLSVRKNDISITGSTINPNGGVKIKTFGDHRIAMSFKVMSLICDKQLSFDDLECINISYPDFNKHLNALKVENGL